MVHDSIIFDINKIQNINKQKKIVDGFIILY